MLSDQLDCWDVWLAAVKWVGVSSSPHATNLSVIHFRHIRALPMLSEASDQLPSPPGFGVELVPCSRGATGEACNCRLDHLQHCAWSVQGSLLQILHWPTSV